MPFLEPNLPKPLPKPPVKIPHCPPTGPVLRPQPQPVRPVVRPTAGAGAAGVGAAAALRCKADRCPDESDAEIKIESKKGGQPTPKKRARVRPCGEAKPIVTYTERTRILGYYRSVRLPRWAPLDLFDIPQFREWIVDEFDIGSSGAVRLAKKYPYLRATAVTNLEVLVAHRSGRKYAFSEAPREFYFTWNAPCWFRIEKIELRRKCKCPDGSKCKTSTTVISGSS